MMPVHGPVHIQVPRFFDLNEPLFYFVPVEAKQPRLCSRRYYRWTRHNWVSAQQSLDSQQRDEKVLNPRKCVECAIFAGLPY